MNKAHGSYTHKDAERRCRLCVEVARGKADDATLSKALDHLEQIRAEVLRTLQSLAVDGLVDRISNANLAITIGKEHPELRPTQSCMSWATGDLEKRGEIAKVVNFIPGTRMRQPNGYRLTAA